MFWWKGYVLLQIRATLDENVQAAMTEHYGNPDYALISVAVDMLQQQVVL